MKNLYQEFKIYTGLGQPNPVYVGNQIKQCESQIALYDSEIALYNANLGDVVDAINQIDGVVVADNCVDAYFAGDLRKNNLIKKKNKVQNKLTKLEKMISGL